MTKGTPKPAVCIIDDCGRAANVPGAARGYCQKHYARVWKHGDPHVTLITLGNDPVCTVADCDRVHQAKGLCKYHYSLRRRASQPACKVDDCPAPAYSRGWCQAHYMRWWHHRDVRAGEPLLGHLPPGLHWCPACRRVKPADEFGVSTTRYRGVTSYCRPCLSHLRRTRWRVMISRQQYLWRLRNPDRTAAYNRQWQTKNPDKVRAKIARQRARWPERYRQYMKTGDHNRRVRERNAVGSATTAQRAARWAYFGGRCWMCGKPADVMDHVKPLARGGSGWPANLRPACTECNNRKRARWPYPIPAQRAEPVEPASVAEADPLDR